MFLPEQLVVIHNSVPVETYSWGRFQGRSNVRVLYFANLEITKGWQVLLEAAMRICAMRDDVFFDFYGNPVPNSSIAAIHQAFQTSGYPDRICFHGPAYGLEKHQAFEKADIFCFPTFFPVETFGLVNLEAMNAGLPIISTDHASIPEVVIEGLGGFLVAKNDGEALSAAIIRLAEDNDLRLRMGRFNQQRFYEHFTVDRFVDRWIELILKLGDH